MLRSGTMANSIAPHHVVSGGKNEVLPNATGMATHSAKTASEINTKQMPTSKISWPLARCSVMIKSSWTSGLVSSACARG